VTTHLKTVNEFLDEIVKERYKQGRDIYADLLMDEFVNTYTLRLYNREIDAVLRVRISHKALIDGKIYDIIKKAFNTYPFNEPSPLEKLL
jgi:hypothetical protein